MNPKRGTAEAVDERLIIRCAVYDGETPVEVKEQAVPRWQLPVALRRVHFNSSFVAAMEAGYSIEFSAHHAARGKVSAGRRGK